MDRKSTCAKQSLLIFQMLLAVALLSWAPAMAQQICGEPGSPSATVTPDGLGGTTRGDHHGLDYAAERHR